MSTPTADVRPGHRRQPAAGRPRGRPRRRGRPGDAARAASSRPWSRSCGPRGRLGRLGRRARRRARAVRAGRHVPARRCRCPRTRSRRLLRGLQQRHPLADLPRRHRAGDLPPGLVERPTATSTAASPRRWPRSPPRARTVWVHDYQLQLVPAMVRELRPDVRIGWFNHIPFPPVELFAQLPWRAPLLEGLLGADFLGFQRTADAENFLRACRQLLGMPTKGDTVVFTPHGSGAQERTVRASAIPISVDFRGLEQLARSPEVIAARQGDPRVLGNPRVLHARRRPARLHQGHPAPAQGLRGAAARARRSRRRTRCSCRSRPRAASGSRPTASCARRSRRPSGGSTASTPTSASPAVQYLHHSYGREEMAALFLAADVMLVTPAARRHEPRRQGVRRLPHRPGRRAGPLRVHRRLARAAPGLRLQPARHRGPQADDHVRHQHARARRGGG